MRYGLKLAKLLSYNIELVLIAPSLRHEKKEVRINPLYSLVVLSDKDKLGG